MSQEPIWIETPEDESAYCGGGCDWKGSSGELAEPDGAHLSAGDPSPAGRCPVCDSLAYLVEDYITRAVKKALATRKGHTTLLRAASALLRRWGRGNLTVQIQALDRAVKAARS